MQLNANSPQKHLNGSVETIYVSCPPWLEDDKPVPTETVLPWEDNDALAHTASADAESPEQHPAMLVGNNEEPGSINLNAFVFPLAAPEPPPSLSEPGTCVYSDHGSSAISIPTVRPGNPIMENVGFNQDGEGNNVAVADCQPHPFIERTHEMHDMPIPDAGAHADNIHSDQQQQHVYDDNTAVDGDGADDDDDFGLLRQRTYGEGSLRRRTSVISWKDMTEDDNEANKTPPPPDPRDCPQVDAILCNPLPTRPRSANRRPSPTRPASSKITPTKSEEVEESSSSSRRRDSKDSNGSRGGSASRRRGLHSASIFSREGRRHNEYPIHQLMRRGSLTASSREEAKKAYPITSVFK